MKKIIGELTLKEIMDYCDSRERCANCPLERICDGTRKFGFVSLMEEDLDKEEELLKW